LPRNRLRQTRVSVVVVTWNALALLRECLDSIRQQTCPAEWFDVVVVDNGSIDGTADALAADYPEVRVIQNADNLGYAAGANLGIDTSASPFVIVLNNDAVAGPDLVASLLRAMDGPDAHRVAAVTARVVLADSGLLNSTGNVVSRQGRGFDRDWKRPDDGSRPAGPVFGFCGAAAILRREALDDCGLFDDHLFLYYEDSDLSWRLRAAGWTIQYEPTAMAVHRHASSSGEGSARFHFWNERNSLIVFTRHAPGTVVVLMHLRRLVGLVAHTLRAPRSSVTGARWRAAADHLRRLPLTLRERRQTWADAAVPRREVAGLLTRRTPSSSQSR
jgi:N-acetylglucosaminyl-diphospho-decaprenol L-rhamnosyltransferase